MSSSSYSRGTSTDSTSTDDNSRSLQLAVFDLDYTIWYPEMYQLNGRPRLTKAGAKLSAVERHETRTTQDGMILTDKSGTPIRVFSGAWVYRVVMWCVSDHEKEKSRVVLLFEEFSAAVCLYNWRNGTWNP
jgi:hypothetical protein